MPIALFLIAKLVVYTLWCWYGIRLLAPTRRLPHALALGLAVLRIVAGLALGFAWASVAKSVVPNEVGFELSGFIAGFLFLRLFQWSIISWLIRLGTARHSFLGTGVADWLWRFGGVALSFVGDIFALVLYLNSFRMIC